MAQSMAEDLSFISRQICLLDPPRPETLPSYSVSPPSSDGGCLAGNLGHRIYKGSSKEGRLARCFKREQWEGWWWWLGIKVAGWCWGERGGAKVDQKVFGEERSKIRLMERVYWASLHYWRVRLGYERSRVELLK